MSDVQGVIELSRLENGNIRMDVTLEAFAMMLGYSCLEEFIEQHNSLEQGLDHWEERWGSYVKVIRK